MRVVADSHAVVWYLQGSKRLSRRAHDVLGEAESEGNLVVSVASLIDLWYVSQTTKSVSEGQLAALRGRLEASASVRIEPVNLAVANATMAIPRSALADPWDRLIVATALALEVPLVTRDAAIEATSLVSTIW